MGYLPKEFPHMYLLGTRASLAAEARPWLSNSSNYNVAKFELNIEFATFMYLFCFRFW